MPTIRAILYVLPFIGLLPAAEPAFHERVLPFFEAHCLDCHDDDTEKGGLSLEALGMDFSDQATLEIWRMVLDQLHFREMPPEKRKRQPTENERSGVIDWVRAQLRHTQEPGSNRPDFFADPRFGNYVDHNALFDQRRDRVDPAPPRIWRLRTDIYEQLAPDLNPGDPVRGLANGLGMKEGSGFKDYASGYFIDEASTAPLLGNAKMIAEKMLSEKGRLHAVKALGQSDRLADRAIIHKALGEVFRQALGRLPSTEEQERFHAFYQAATKMTDPRTGARSMITAVLMQPEFFFRQELGDGDADAHGRVRLTSREIAFALSYALSDQPLPVFMDAARTDGLQDGDAIRELVATQLEQGDLGRHPRLLQFFREYFNYPFATEVFKDKPPHVEYKADLLVKDLEFTIREILRRDEEVLKTLLTSRAFHVNVAIETKNGPNKGKLKRGHEKAKHYHSLYSLPLDWRWSAERQPVHFPADERAGVLTHPAWLAAWSGNFENHPVQRGLWVRTRLLGGSVPDVPIGVDARVPEQEHASFRNRLQQATAAPECWRCHRKMDPIGLAFERFDHYGRVQRRDAGQVVDPRGRIDRTPWPELHRSFEHPAAMMDFLAGQERVEQVFTRHAFRYFLGRNETLGDANTLQDAHRAYREHKGSFRALATSLLASDSFILRQAETPPP